MTLKLNARERTDIYEYEVTKGDLQGYYIDIKFINGKYDSNTLADSFNLTGRFEEGITQLEVISDVLKTIRQLQKQYEKGE